MTHYDIHCHVFNKNVVVRKLVNIIQSLLTIEEILDDDLPSDKLKYKIEGISKVLDDVTQSSEDVFEVLNNAYNKELVVTPLMFDLTYVDDNDGNESKNNRYRRRIKRIFWVICKILPIVKGKIRRKFKDEPDLLQIIDKLKDNIEKLEKSFKKKKDNEVNFFDDANYTQQINDLEYLAGKYSNIMPFFSVDPRRENKGKVAIVKKLEEKLLGDNPKFFGVKLYAPAGFSPTDPVLMGNNGVYAFCEANNIPITVHNSNAGFACFSSNLAIRGHVFMNEQVVRIRKTIKFQNKFFSLKVSDAIKERARMLNHPKLWELVLKKYKNLHINFAHFGGSGQIMDYLNYKFPKTKFETEDLEELISHLSPKQQRIILSGFIKKRKFMYLREDLTYRERAVMWNALYYGGLIDNWAKEIFDLVRNEAYPNAYTDLSCFSEGKLIHSPGKDKLIFTIKENLETFKKSFFNKLSEYEKSKLLYGSDFFLAQFFGPTIEQYYTDFKTAFGSDFDRIAGENPRRFLGIN